jgi:ATP-dependent Clp protease ATP-binding subunit ClpA
MYDRFTDRAAKVLKQAEQEARRLHHDVVANEHILLSLAKDETCAAANVLTILDIDLPSFRRVLEQEMPEGADMVRMGNLPFAPRAAIVIQSAESEASRLGSRAAGTEHLLLALMHEKEGEFISVFTRYGQTLRCVKEQTLALLGKSAAVEDQDPSDEFGLDEPLTERAWRVMELARQEARRTKHEVVGTEHILLGLLAERHGIFGHLFAEFGVTFDRVASAVRAATRPGPFGVPVCKEALTVRSKLALERAAAEARKQRCVRIDSHHLLLGLLSRNSGLATEILGNLGISTVAVYQKLRRVTIFNPHECYIFQSPWRRTPRDRWLENFEHRLLVEREPWLQLLLAAGGLVGAIEAGTAFGYPGSVLGFFCGCIVALHGWFTVAALFASLAGAALGQMWFGTGWGSLAGAILGSVPVVFGPRYLSLIRKRLAEASRRSADR